MKFGKKFSSRGLRGQRGWGNQSAAPCFPYPRLPRNPRLNLCLCVFVSSLFTLISNAEVIDRIVAVVNGHIITLSDIRQEREMGALLGEKQPENDEKLAREMIDTYLIEQQIADSPDIGVTDSELDAELKKLKVRSDAITETLRNTLRLRIQIQKFFDMRFRQLIRPTDEEIRKYYEEVFVPEARKRGLQSIPPLTESDLVSAIRENVIQENLDHEVEVWLEAIRRRSNVEIF
jgi:peptidyl-prolyl cis-trans isomerase SurA